MIPPGPRRSRMVKRTKFGSFSVGALLGGFALEALWLCFVTGIVLVFSSAIRGLLGVVGASIALLLALALLGNLPAVSSWLPTKLAGSEADLVKHAADGIWRAAVITGVATVAAVSLGVYRLGQYRR